MEGCLNWCLLYAECLLIKNGDRFVSFPSEMSLMLWLDSYKFLDHDFAKSNVMMTVCPSVKMNS